MYADSIYNVVGFGGELGDCTRMDVNVHATQSGTKPTEVC